MSDEMCPVTLSALNQDRFGIHFIVLSDQTGRHLPIWIHECEAFAIGICVHGAQTPRPMTHDLVRHATEKLGGSIERLVIDDLWQDTYYAKLVVRRGEDEWQVDCRPSDGLALALRVGAPVLVRDDVMEEGRVELPLGDEGGPDETADG